MESSLGREGYNRAYTVSRSLVLTKSQQNGWREKVAEWADRLSEWVADFVDIGPAPVPIPVSPRPKPRRPSR